MPTQTFRQIIRRVWSSARVALKITHTITGLTSGDKDVAVAGTRVRLIGTATPMVYVDIQAKEDNTKAVVVGGSNVVAALATRKGNALFPLSAIRIEGADLQDVWIDALQPGEGVTFNYFN